jgi:hypothetical protein
MTSYIWAIDTPWAKKGEEYNDEEKVTYCKPTSDRRGLVSLSYRGVTQEKLLDIGWIKPVEDKKLTEEEILAKITLHVDTLGNCYIDGRKLAKFLAEHLK